MATKVCPGFEEEPESWKDDDEPAQAVPPRAQECLPCYVLRMLDAYGCERDFHWVRLWQEERRSRRDLTRWLRREGANCDCEVLYNVFPRLVGPEFDEAPPPPCDHGPVADPGR